MTTQNINPKSKLNIPFSISCGEKGYITLSGGNYDGIVVTNPHDFYIYFPDADQWIPPRWFNFVFAYSPSPLTTVNWDATQDPNGVPQGKTGKTAIGILSNTLSDYAGGGALQVSINGMNPSYPPGGLAGITSGYPGIEMIAEGVEEGSYLFSHPQPLIADGTTGSLKVQNSPEIFWSSNGLPQQNSITLPASTQTFIGNWSCSILNARMVWLHVNAPGGGITSAWSAGITNLAITDQASKAYYQGRSPLSPAAISNSGQDAIFGPFILPPFPINTIAFTLDPGATAFAGELFVLAGVEGNVDARYPPQQSVALAISATTTVIPGITGQSIRLRKANIQSYIAASASNYGHFQDTTGAIVLWNINFITTGPFNMDFEGLALPSGAGLEWVLGGGNCGINGAITFDQY